MLKARSSNVLSEETRMTVDSFAAVFRDVTQRSPERGTSRKKAAKETRMTADHDSFGSTNYLHRQIAIKGTPHEKVHSHLYAQESWLLMLQIRTKRIAFLFVKCYVNSCTRLAHTNNTQSESCGSPVAMIRK